MKRKSTLLNEVVFDTNKMQINEMKKNVFERYDVDDIDILMQIKKKLLKLKYHHLQQL